MRNIFLLGLLLLLELAFGGLIARPLTVTFTHTATQPLCFGSTGSISLSPSGGSGTYEYSKDGGSTWQTSPNFTGLAAGSYDLVVRDAANPTDVSAPPVSVTINAAPPAIIASAGVTSSYNGAHISCNGQSDGQITVTASGGTGALQYKNTTAGGSYQPGNVFGSLGASSYTFTVKDANNCTANTSSVAVTAPPALAATGAVSSNYSGENISCNGQTDGQITVTANGGTGSKQYKNTTAGGSYQPGNIFGSLGANSYTFTVKDANNCTANTSSVVVTAPPALTATGAVSSNYNGENISCNGQTDGQITVTANGGTGSKQYKNTTAGGSYQVGSVFGSLAANNYTFTVKDANNCTANTSAVAVTAPTALTASGAITSNYNGANISCNGQSDGQITVTASGGTGSKQYKNITAGGSYQPGSVFGSLGANSYTFTVKDANNCTVNTSAVAVTAPPALTASASVSSTLLCHGDSDGEITLTASGGTGSKEYKNTTAGGSYQAGNVFSNLSANTYVFMVKDINNCITTVSKTLTEPVALSATNTTDISVCEGEAITLQIGSLVARDASSLLYKWIKNPAPASPGVGAAIATTASFAYEDSATLADAGNYQVRIIDALCADTIYRNANLIMHTNPVVSFGLHPSTQKTCKGTALSFMSTSSAGAVGVPLAVTGVISPSNGYSWRWGDGDTTSSTGASASHSYSAAASRTVTLQATTNFGCTASGTNTYTIHPRAVPGFSHAAPKSYCADSIINFSNSTALAPGGSFWNVWIFGDATDNDTTTGTGGSSHSYLTHGNKTVKLLVTTNQGCIDSITNTFDVGANPVPSFSYTAPDSFCVDSVIHFTNATTLASGAYHSQWTWGDSNQDTTVADTVPIITHKYPAHGTYTVTLRATTDGFGCSDTAKRTFAIGANPIPGFAYAAPDSFCVDSVIHFTNATTLASGTYHSKWSWGVSNQDTTVTGLAPVTHKYLTHGSYTVTLRTTTDNFGCSKATSKGVSIGANPVPNFAYTAPDSFCVDSVIHFTNTTPLVPGSSYQSQWSWGVSNQDTTVVGLAPVTHKYLTHGSYTVTLRATTDGFGCSDTAKRTFAIGANPVPSFAYTAPDLFCVDSVINFTNGTTLASGAYQSQWAWGDSKPDSTVVGDDSVTHRYLAHGTYTVTMRATTDNFGCSKATSKGVSIGANPVPDFAYTAPDSFCVDSVIHFTNKTTLVSGAYQSKWTWADSKPDSIVTGGAAVTHKYLSHGTYTVTLRATTDGFGCSDTAKRTFAIYANPVPAFNLLAPNAHFCHDSVITASNLTTMATPMTTVKNTWQWGHNTPDSISWGTAGATQRYAPDEYLITLISENTLGGCTDRISKLQKIYPNPVSAFTGKQGCADSALTFNEMVQLAANPASQVTQWEWRWADGSTGTGANPTHTYEHAGTYNVVLKATTDRGCSNADTMAITVYDSPVFNFLDETDVVNRDTVCAGATGISYSINPDPRAAVSNVWSLLQSGAAIANGGQTPNMIADFTTTPGNVVFQIRTQIAECVVDSVFAVTVLPAVAPVGNIIYKPLGNSNILSCSIAGAAWQWGYDDMQTGVSYTLPGQTAQFYAAGAAFDPAYKAYWVLVNAGTCSSKLYYNLPTATDPGATTGAALTLWPNPAHDVVTVAWGQPYPGTMAHLSLLDMTGREVYHQSTLDEQTAVSLAGLPAGAYLLKVSVNDLIISQTLIIQ